MPVDHITDYHAWLDAAAGNPAYQRALADSIASEILTRVRRLEGAWRRYQYEHRTGPSNLADQLVLGELA
jgi:hypothetical protein